MPSNQPTITAVVLLLGYVIRVTPGLNKIMPYYAAIAFLLGACLGALVHGATLTGITQGAVDALVATGIYEVGSNVAKGVIATDTRNEED